MLVPQASQPPQHQLKIVKRLTEINDLKKKISTYYPRTLKPTSSAETIADNKRKVKDWALTLEREHGIRAIFNPDDSKNKRVEYKPVDTKAIDTFSSQNRLERSV